MLPLLALLLAGPGPRHIEPDSFPHAAHRHLFASCTTCHSGIVTGDSAQTRPAPASCSACHDGRIVREVNWVPTPPRPTNLRFDHRTHLAAAPDSVGANAACRDCHAITGSAVFMEVERAQPQRCLTCHTHQAESHLASGNRCATCHVPVTQATQLSAATIAAFPKPASHDTGFVFHHAEAARRETTCQVCHSRESCASCHVNAARLAPIQALASDERIAQLMRGRTVTYRPPASHAANDFIRGHGLQARTSAQTCANCHTRESCLICHSEQSRVPIVASLPRREPGGAPGVDLAAMRPPLHEPGFRTNHRVAAAGGDASCSQCHSQSYCATCHDAARSPSFHPLNFVSRHANAAMTRENDCATCHQVQAFCRDCHLHTGLAPVAVNTQAKFHSRQPNWLFAHGSAARRDLESCTSCHQQNYCVSCHSPAGQGVDPHGPGFNPAMGNKNPAMCRTCHAQGPPKG